MGISRKRKITEGYKVLRKGKKTDGLNQLI